MSRARRALEWTWRHATAVTSARAGLLAVTDSAEWPARSSTSGADDVLAAMPPLADRLDLAERTMTALVADAELPPKIGLHPTPAESFAHAMPAMLRPGVPTRRQARTSSA